MAHPARFDFDQYLSLVRVAELNLPDDKVIARLFQNDSFVLGWE
jgi:hypothetical protein